MSEKADDRKSGVPQIEVTPEMFSAGWDALLSYESRDFPDKAMIRDVFEAVLFAAPPEWCGGAADVVRSHLRQQRKA